MILMKWNVIYNNLKFFYFESGILILSDYFKNKNIFFNSYFIYYDNKLLKSRLPIE